MRGVNLIPHYYLTARGRRIRSQKWMGGVLGYVVALMLGWAMLHLTSGGAQHAVALQIKEAEARIEDTTTAIKHMEPRLNESLATLVAGQSVGEQPNWSILLRLVGERLGDNAVLTRCHLEPAHKNAQAHKIVKQYVLHLDGLARSHEMVSNYVLSLERLGLFASVKMKSTRREPWGAQTAVVFQIDCVIGSQTDEKTD